MEDPRFSRQNLKAQARINAWTMECARASKEHERQQLAKAGELDPLPDDDLPDYIRTMKVATYNPWTGEIRMEQPGSRL